MIIPSGKELLGREVLRIYHTLGSEWVFVCLEYAQHWVGSHSWLALVVFRGLWLLSWCVGLAPWWLWHYWRNKPLSRVFVPLPRFGTSSVHYIFFICTILCLLWPAVLMPYWPVFLVVSWTLVRQIVV